jgi:hypothetical protein
VNLVEPSGYAEPASPEPAYPEPAYHEPAYHEPAYPDEPAVYNYAYAVADEYSGTKLNAKENRDEYKTSGSYQVFMAPGPWRISVGYSRVQVVC